MTMTIDDITSTINRGIYLYPHVIISNIRFEGDVVSANDQIVIMREGKIYKAYYNGCVDNDFSPDKCLLIATADSHEEITKVAKDWYSDNYDWYEPEYGIMYAYPTKVVEE